MHDVLRIVAYKRVVSSLCRLMPHLYAMHTDPLHVMVPLVQECLNIFGGSGGPESHTALKMCYAGYGHPLTLLYVCMYNYQLALTLHVQNTLWLLA